MVTIALIIADFINPEFNPAILYIGTLFLDTCLACSIFEEIKRIANRG